MSPVDASSVLFLESGPKSERIHHEITRKTVGAFLLPLL